MKIQGFSYAAASIQAAPRTSAPPPPSRGSRLTELVQQIRLDGDWQSRGACIGKPQSWWFATSTSTSHHYDRARTICERCPVQEQCLEAALRGNELAGFWGGKSRGERAEIRAERRRASKL